MKVNFKTLITFSSLISTMGITKAGDILFGEPVRTESIIVNKRNPFSDILQENKSFKDPIYSILEESFPAQVEGRGQNPQEIIKKLEERIEEQLKFRSGDDVGNGGDHLRSLIIKEIKALSVAIKVKTPTTENLVIINDLGAPYAHKSHHGVDLILLDRKIWTSAFEKNLDIRALLLQVLLPGHKNILGLYQSLEPKFSRPFCYFDFTNDLTVKEAFDFEGVNKESANVAEKMAYNQCTSQELVGCHKINQEYSGLFGQNKHRVTVRGYKVTQKELSGSEKRQLACRAALMCEELTFSAPFNQVSPSDFDVVSEAVAHFCQ